MEKKTFVSAFHLTRVVFLILRACSQLIMGCLVASVLAQDRFQGPGLNQGYSGSRGYAPSAARSVNAEGNYVSSIHKPCYLLRKMLQLYRYVADHLSRNHINVILCFTLKI